MTFSDPIVDDTVLVRPAIQSPDYAPGVSGWAINGDGSAEFDAATVRGTFTGAGAMQSAGYVPGAAGWAVKADGTAEFGNAQIRGSLRAGPVGAAGGIYAGPAAAVADVTTDAGVLRGLGLDAGTVYRYGTGSRMIVDGIEYAAGGASGVRKVYAVGPGGAILGRPIEITADAVNGVALLNLGQLCADVTLMGRSLPRGPVTSSWSLTNSVAFGTVDTELMRLSAVNLQAGRAYAVRFGQLVQADTAATRAAFRLRDAGGADLGDPGRFPTPTANEPVSAQGVAYLANRGAADVVLDVRLTAFTTAGTAFLRTTTVTPRFLALDDVGAASAFPYAVGV